MSCRHLRHGQGPQLQRGAVAVLSIGLWAGLPPGSGAAQNLGPQNLGAPGREAAWDLPSLRLTDNQRSMGLGLHAIRPTAGLFPDDTRARLLDPLLLQPAAALPPLLDRLSGTHYGDGLLSALERSRSFGSVLSEQMAAFHGGPGMADAMARRTAYRAWTSGLSHHLRNGAEGGTAYHASAVGAAAGADMLLRDGLLAGIAAGYSSGRTVSPSTVARATLGTLHLSAYGSWTWDGFFVDAQAGVSRLDLETRRDLGVFAMTARGSGQGWGSHAALEAGRGYSIGGWRLEPSLGLRFDQMSRDALQESTAGPLSLAMRGDTASSLRSLVGLRASTLLPLGEGYGLAPSLRLQWAHEFADTGTVTQATFPGAPEAAMRLRSAGGGRDAALVGLGLTLGLPSGLAAFASYNAALRTNATAQSVTAGIRYSW